MEMCKWRIELANRVDVWMDNCRTELSVYGYFVVATVEARRNRKVANERLIVCKTFKVHSTCTLTLNSTVYQEYCTGI